MLTQFFLRCQEQLMKRWIDGVVFFQKIADRSIPLFRATKLGQGLSQVVRRTCMTGGKGKELALVCYCSFLFS